MNLSDRPRRQERRRLITGRHEDAIGDARVEMHVLVERRAEAVDEGDGTEPRACGGGTREACRSAQESLYSRDEDPREGCDRALAVGEEAAQPLGHGDHPLAHGHWWDDMIDQVCGRLRHASAIARRTDASSLARERHHKSLAAALTSRPRKPEAEDAAFQILTQFLLHLCWDATLLQQPPLEPTLQKLTDDLVKRRAFRPPPLVAGQPPREWPAWANRRQWPSNAGGYAGTRGGRAYVIKRTLYNSTTVAAKAPAADKSGDLIGSGRPT